MKKQSEITALADSENVSSEDRWLHDAEIWGDLNTEFDGFLEREITFMTGKLYPDDNRKSTRDGDWQATTLPLVTWLNDPNFGLLRHPVGKTKDGTSICPSVNIDGARKDSAVKTMTAIGIDVDSGTSVDHVLAKLEAAEIFAIVYTTFNHLTTRLELKHDDVMRKLALDASPDLAQIKEYLRLHHATRYDAAFIEAVEIEDTRTQTKDGMRIVLNVPAIDKFRVVIPLAEPVELADLAPTLAGWKDIWADKVTGACVNMLDTEFDTASCDVNRLFFCPRHKEGAEFYSAIVMGKPLRFEEIKPFSKSEYIKGRQPQGDPFLAGGSEGEVERFLMPESGRSLNKWHNEHKHRFLIADLMEAHAADKVHNVGGERDGTIHIECPFEHEHSTRGGTATMVMNPHANEKEVWTVFCHHDACKGRHKLEFLQQILVDEWFPESVLTDDEFLLDAEESEPETVTLKESAIERRVAVLELDHDTGDADVKAFLEGLMAEGADTATLARAKTVLTQKTAFGKSDLNQMIKTIHAENRAKQPAKKSDAINVGDGYMPVIEATIEKLITANAASPFLFSYMEGLVEVRTSDGAKIKTLDYDGLTTLVASEVQYEKMQKMGEDLIPVSVAPPFDVMKNISHRPHKDFTLPLKGVVKAPFFTRDGTLVDVPGYNEDAQVYYAPPPGFVLPRVAGTPSDDDVREALRLIIEEVLADFPLGGYSREEIVERCKPGGEGVPAVANFLAMILLFFMRDMVDGPTPMHLFNKPAPGVGASLLSSVCHIIATGGSVKAQSMAKKQEELGKQISASLLDGDPMIMFDNVNHSVDSAELANAITADDYKARILGKTQNVDTEVRVLWAITANSLNMTSELLRRCVLIDLDADHADPKERKGPKSAADAETWTHPDIKAWVRDNRGELVWACLTLIQNWIAKGCERYEGETLGSFENYVAVMGGVLDAAGLGGFLGNKDQLKEDVSDAGANSLTLFLTELASYQDGQAFRSGSTADGAKSLLDVLNGGCEETGHKPIEVDGWGYSKEDSTYHSSGTIGAKFGQVAKKPWRVVRDGKKIELRFKTCDDKRAGTKYYVMSKTVLGDV